jgi:hypothetical protein
MWRGEGCVGEHALPVLAEANQVVSVGAIAMAKNDEAVGLACSCGEPWAANLN